MSTRAEILNGADFEGYEDFCAEVVNAIKNHYRESDPCVNMVSRQPGEILSDPDDDKLYHVGGASGYPCDEILQASRSCDVIPDFKGVDFYSSCFGDYATIRGINEPGLGHRLTIGLDETARTMVICDLGDVDVDLGLASIGHPTLYFFDDDHSHWTRIYQGGSYFTIESISGTNNSFILRMHQWVYFQLDRDLNSGNVFTFNSGANIELTDTNAEQAWMYLEAKIKQTSTAGYVAVLVDVTETSLGDASAGAGYNALMDLRIAGVTQFGIQRDGKIMTNQVEAGAIAAYDQRLPVYDGTGSFVGYVAIYASP